MHTPPLHKQDKNAQGTWPQAGGTPRYTKHSGSLPPCRPSVMAARMLVPALASAAAWTSVWIGPLFAALLSIWTCWAVIAIARKVPVSTPKLLYHAAFGERVWLNLLGAKTRPVPAGKIPVLYLTATAGLLAAIAGGLFTSPLVTGTGLAVATIAQYVCLQRLADLYRAQKNAHPLYRFWEAKPANDDNGNAAPQANPAQASPAQRNRQRPPVR